MNDAKWWAVFTAIFMLLITAMYIFLALAIYADTSDIPDVVETSVVIETQDFLESLKFDLECALVSEAISQSQLEELAYAAQMEKDCTFLDFYTLTAYCACDRCCRGSADGITATGTIPVQGRTIAVDPRVIPYGTEVTFLGNTYIAEDCGGAIKGNRIDVYFDSHQEALEFGVKVNVPVYLY